MIYFLAPFFNEEEFLKKFLEDLIINNSSLLKKDYKIVLINDGSNDRSLEIVKSFQKKNPIIIISYKKNQGVDYAFRRGFIEIFKTAKKNDLIFTLESDNTSDLKIIKKMIEKSKNADFVLASCYAKGGGVYGTGLVRQLASKIANMLLYILFPINGVKTYSSFYRLYKVETFKKAWNAYNGKLINQKGFVCMAEMLIKLSSLPVKIEEVPMILKWQGRKGKSKMKITRTIFGYWLLFKDLFINEKFKKNNIFDNALNNWKKI